MVQQAIYFNNEESKMFSKYKYTSQVICCDWFSQTSSCLHIVHFKHFLCHRVMMDLQFFLFMARPFISPYQNFLGK